MKNIDVIKLREEFDNIEYMHNKPLRNKDEYIEWLEEKLVKKLTIPVVIVPKGTLSDFEKWLDKKGNESYCGLPSQYVLDKYKSLNAL